MKIVMIFIVPMVIFLSGCITTGTPPMTQAAIKAFETRTVDAPFEQVYSGAAEGLFDLGYTVVHTDKNTGILVGEKRMKKPGAEWMKISDDMNKVIRSESDYYDILQLTLFIQTVDSASTKVRIKTAVNKSPQLNKEAIDEVWLYIERQVLMESGPTAPKISGENK